MIRKMSHEEMFPKTSRLIRQSIAEAQEPTWHDWLFSRIHYLQYMGHPKREATKIAKAEMKLLRLSKE